MPGNLNTKPEIMEDVKLPPVPRGKSLFQDLLQEM